MLMYNLLKYRDNNSMISGSLWNYYKDEIDDNANKNGNNSVNNKKTVKRKYIGIRQSLYEARQTIIIVY